MTDRLILPLPAVYYADHSFPAYSRAQMVNFAKSALRAAAIAAERAYNDAFISFLAEAREAILAIDVGSDDGSSVEPSSVMRDYLSPGD